VVQAKRCDIRECRQMSPGRDQIAGKGRSLKRLSNARKLEDARRDWLAGIRFPAEWLLHRVDRAEDNGRK
jgi:hypothetical protein